MVFSVQEYEGTGKLSPTIKTADINEALIERSGLQSKLSYTHQVQIEEIAQLASRLHAKSTSSSRYTALLDLT